jgi:hypothetical protein
MVKPHGYDEWLAKENEVEGLSELVKEAEELGGKDLVKNLIWSHAKKIIPFKEWSDEEY